MIAKKKADIDALREGGGLLAKILKHVAERVHPGTLTIELDALAEKEIRAVGGIPAFKFYQTHGTKMPYPATLCVSVNNEVVHAIPGNRPLEDGDVVSLDIGMKYKGFYTDTAITVGVGKIAATDKKLINVTKKSLAQGIKEIRKGAALGDIGAAIQEYAEREGFGVVRELVGHGVGKAVHEDPEIPNWGTRGEGMRLQEGMVIAIEPMLTIGSPRVKVSRDGWTWATVSGAKAAHFEHTVLVTKNGSEILTHHG